MHFISVLSSSLLYEQLHEYYHIYVIFSIIFRLPIDNMYMCIQMILTVLKISRAFCTKSEDKAVVIKLCPPAHRAPVLSASRINIRPVCALPCALLAVRIVKSLVKALTAVSAARPLSIFSLSTTVPPPAAFLLRPLPAKSSC